MRRMGRSSEADSPPLLANDQSVSVRTTGRIKKPKAVFDPSDNYLPRAQRSTGTGNAASTSTPFLAPATGLNSMRRRKSLPQYDAGSDNNACPIKKIRLPNNPSSINAPCTSLSLNVMGGDALDACIVCLKKEAKRGTYAKNKLIACVRCDRRVHKLCMSMDFDDLESLRQNYRCDNCRSCELCDTIEIDAKFGTSDLITCAKCVKSYHLRCHIPNILPYQRAQRGWKCNKCSVALGGVGSDSLPVEMIREIIGNEPTIRSLQHQGNKIVTAAESKANTTSIKHSYKEAESNANADAYVSKSVEAKNNCKNDVASMLRRFSPNESLDALDVKYWTVDQVTEFFSKYFPDEAYVFKEQEIDGTSLLLLKRSDVVKKLPIKLGPSLRIYSLILNLQTQLYDQTLGWECGI